MLSPPQQTKKKLTCLFKQSTVLSINVSLRDTALVALWSAVIRVNSVRAHFPCSGQSLSGRAAVSRSLNTRWGGNGYNEMLFLQVTRVQKLQQKLK